MPSVIKMKNMSEKTKVYIFEKIEIALIFMFMILIAITSFVLGVKVGKNYSYQQAGITVEDQARVELLSKKEEMVEKNVQAQESTGTGIHLEKEELLKQNDARLSQKIEEAIYEKEGPAPKGMEEPQVLGKKTSVIPEPKASPRPEAKAESPTIAPTPAPAEGKLKVGEFTGKFTIQLGSHRSKEEAEKFADGFRIRGHNPIISEVELRDKGGTWYRVSLGVFETIADAKDYILNKERALFQGQDYVIVRFE
jgi:cell division protein FtsN